MNKIVLFLIVCSFGFNDAYAQKSLNDYKYVIVPNRYEFFNEDDKYRLNTLTKFLFKKYGFEALMADEPFPDDLKNDNCAALKASVINHRGMLKTKLEVNLRDCSNELVFQTQIGVSRVKEYKKAFNLALRNAFESFQTANYKYNGKESKSSVTKIEPVEKPLEVKETLEEVKDLKTKEEPKLTKITKVEKSESTTIKKVDKTHRDIKHTKVLKEAKKIEVTKKVIDNNLFTTQKIFNGYKLIDSNSKEVITIFKSGVSDIFIVKGKDAIIYKKEDKWIYSETNETNLLTKLINIKF